MLMRLAAIALLCAATTTAVQAQTTDRQRYVQCRSQAIAAGVSGDEYAPYIETCMAASGASAAPGQFASCQSQAHAAASGGEAYGRSLDLCMNGQTSGAPGAPPKTYAECRSEARAKFLSGDALNQYLNGCVGR